jgi:RNA polymerase sigma-70 factor (ECF subfamily)
MPMPDTPEADALRDELHRSWTAYLDLLTPIRGDLFAYCRRLTHSVWDAEDLVQETLLRGFAGLGHLYQPVENLRAYVLRTAANTWIDAQRRRATEERIVADVANVAASPASTPEPDQGLAFRDASTRLLQQLAPQERAAIVLKDLFDLSIREAAELLATTEGAVKHALHRGRARLQDPDARLARRPAPSTALVDRFIALYHASDVQGLVDLLVDGGSAENVGVGLQYGRAAFTGTQHFFYKAVHGHEEWPAAFQPESVRLDVGVFEEEPVVLCFATRNGREALEQVLRLEGIGDKITRLRGYAFCPETMREIGAALGLEVRTGLYRIPDFTAS